MPDEGTTDFLALALDKQARFGGDVKAGGSLTKVLRYIDQYSKQLKHKTSQGFIAHQQHIGHRGINRRT